MIHRKSAYLVLLAGSMIIAASSLPRISTAAGPLCPAGITEQDKKHAGSADDEREEGRRGLRRGEAGEALDHLENALKLYVQGGDKSGEAATLALLGELYEQQGRYGSALEYFQRAHAIYTALPKNKGEYDANLMLANIGNIHYRQGELAAASGAYMRMKVKKPDTGASGKAKRFGALASGIAVGIGSGKSEVGVPATAIGGLVSAKQLFDYYRQTILYAGYETGLGRVDYRNGQFEEARKHFENALSATRSDVPKLGGLGQTRRFHIAARTSLADVALAQGQVNKASGLYEDAAKDARKEKRLDLIWPAERGRGRSLWLQAAEEKDQKKTEKLRTESLNEYRAAIENVDVLRAGSLRADEARATFLATAKDVFEEASSALAEMALMLAPRDSTRALEGQALDYAAEAFRIVEQGRARSLLDLLRESRANLREGVPPDLFKRKQEILDRQGEIAQLLLGVSLTDKPPNVEHLEKEAGELQNEEVTLENRIRVQSPRYNELTSSQPLSLAQIQRQVLDEGTVLLEYSLARESSYLWAVTKDAVRLFRLSSRDALNAEAAEMRRRILSADQGRSILELTTEDKQRALTVRKVDANVPVSAFSKDSYKLYKSILEPAMRVSAARRLLIVPDGALSYVPFDALVTSPEGSDYASLPYLARIVETVYAPSASVAGALRRQASAKAVTGNSPILIVADPVFELDDERAKDLPHTSLAAAARGLVVKSAIADVTGSGKELPADFRINRLPGTRDEAEQIAGTAAVAGFRAERWLDLDASEANTAERDLKAYGLVHIATHGLLDAEHPQFSGVVLSLVGNKGGRDGFLRVDEIFNLRLGNPLVMLSACQTGLGREMRGEGVMGLTRAFMYAGAPLVGVTLWSVNDESTAILMGSFYKQLLAKGGGSPAAALRAARQSLLSTPKYSEPYYWAPFILVGDWRLD